MTSPRPADEAPFALDGTVTRDKLLELLGVQSENTWLDYKAACDLDDRGETVQISKDIGAMCIRAGYLVIGADDHGVALGLPPGQAKHFDEATLRDKVKRYLPPGFELRSAVHALDGDTAPKELAIVWVAPHPDAWAIFAHDGAYPIAGKPKIAFRKGEVYARHGSKSEQWDQGDIAAARANLVAREKDSWREEIALANQQAVKDAISGATAMASPAASYTWRLDESGFEAATVELIRHDDDIPVRRMLPLAEAEVRRCVSTIDEDLTDDLAVPLDRLTALAALALELDRPKYFSMAVRSLLSVYDWAVTDLRVNSSDHRLTPLLHLRIAERLYALGALAVRYERWDQVRELVLAPVPGLHEHSVARTWHRDALTNSARANLLRDASGTREISLLMFGRAVVTRLPVLRPDLPGDINDTNQAGDPVLRSLAQFDFLASVISGVSADAMSSRTLLGASYPNFAQIDGRYANTAATKLLFISGVRDQLLPGATDEQIAIVYALLDKEARHAGRAMWGWEGYTDSRVTDFVNRQLEHVAEDVFS